MPIIHLHRGKQSVVVREAQTGRGVNRSCLRAKHRTTERPTARRIQRSPHLRDAGALKISKLFRRDGRRAVRETSTVGTTGSAERGFKERLRRTSVGVVLAGWSQRRSANRQVHVLIRIGESLTTKRHHVRNGVDIDLFEDVRSNLAHITNFETYLARYLALNREVERIDDFRLIVGIQNGRVAGHRAARHTREEWLRQRGCR